MLYIPLWLDSILSHTPMIAFIVFNVRYITQINTILPQVCVFSIHWLNCLIPFLLVFSGGDRGDSRECLQDLALPHHPVF